MSARDSHKPMRIRPPLNTTLLRQQADPSTTTRRPLSVITAAIGGRARVHRREWGESAFADGCTRTGFSRRAPECVGVWLDWLQALGDAWCVMYDVWCMMCDVTQGHLPDLNFGVFEGLGFRVQGLGTWILASLRRRSCSSFLTFVSRISTVSRSSWCV